MLVKHQIFLACDGVTVARKETNTQETAWKGRFKYENPKSVHLFYGKDGELVKKLKLTPKVWNSGRAGYSVWYENDSDDLTLDARLTKLDGEKFVFDIKLIGPASDIVLPDEWLSAPESNASKTAEKQTNSKKGGKKK